MCVCAHARARARVCVFVRVNYLYLHLCVSGKRERPRERRGRTGVCRGCVTGMAERPGCPRRGQVAAGGGARSVASGERTNSWPISEACCSSREARSLRNPAQAVAAVAPRATPT